jgi:hypothetical protein
MALKNCYKLLIPLLAAVPLLAQSSNILTVEPAAKITAKRGGTVEAKLAVSLQPGFHVNSNTPNEAYLIPLRLTWSPGPLESTAITFPKPSMETYEFSKKPLSVFSGKFEIVSRFKVAGDARVGPALVNGKLRYQACNDKACFPPKTIDVQLPVSIQ